ncbi:GntR family transcriptional regulator [Bacteroidia bacterium]|nr:GntR family transcriptional regulator [Bacteroidia bacterium]GHU89088.1 GntR family transcriptional regulator [Bacteroidia bacterium]
MIQLKTNYKTIYNSLKEEIINNVYPAGSLLPTELQLAARYGVSRPTISKVYNQLQDEEFIKKKKGLGSVITYKSSDRKLIFGLLLPGSGESEIFSIINDQLLKQSESGRFNCLWDGATASSADIRRSLINTCCESYIEKKVDGVFFAPLERVADSQKINLHICNEIQKANIPIILIDRDIVNFPERSEFDLVCLDNFHAGTMMAKLLIDAGCEVIHFFYRPDSAYSVNLRLAGIREMALNSHIRFDEQNVYCADPTNLDLVRRIRIVPGKTGIICANDSTAAVLMSSLDTIGLEVSSDLLMCGFDNMKYSGHLKHSLTSFRQPCEEITDISIDLMFRRVKNKTSPTVTTNLYGEIIKRESSTFV